jgi:pimeloyl-ACP methyl ester carboxylesterase
MTQTELHYERIKTRGLAFEVATHGSGGRLALLLHGFPECAYSWRHQIPLLTRLGYRVWAPNLRGFGHSDKPRGRSAYAVSELEQDITDLIDESGARSVLLVGHDWGGAVAWSYAMYGARPIERLVIMNSPHPARFFESLRTAAQLRRSWYMLLFQLPWLPERLLLSERAMEAAFRGQAVHKERFSDRDIAMYRENARIPGAVTAMLNYYRAMPWTIASQRQRRPKRIEVPTLMLWGEQDRALGLELTERMDELVSDISLRFIPDASHWVQQDAPEAVNRQLEEWLGRAVDRLKSA